MFLRMPVRIVSGGVERDTVNGEFLFLFLFKNCIFVFGSGSGYSEYGYGDGIITSAYMLKGR